MFQNLQEQRVLRRDLEVLKTPNHTPRDGKHHALHPKRNGWENSKLDTAEEANRKFKDTKMI